MPTILELMEKYGVEQATLSSSSPRHKALSQANKMLEKLENCSNVGELNSATSNQNWWSSKPSGGKRRISCRYDSRVFPDLAIMSEDTLESVKQCIEILKKIIEEMDDAEWVSEEKRRKEIPTKKIKRRPQ